MKTNLKSLLALLMLGAATFTLRAQYQAQPQQPGQPPQDQQGQQDQPGPQGSQDQQGPGPQDGEQFGGHHHRPPPSRLFIALDVNHDGVIDANEIANASAVLTTLANTLNTNGTVQLTWAEVCPQRPPRPDWNNNDGTDNQGPPPQDGQQGQSQGQGQHHRPPPDKLFTTLDANHDGVIDAGEIANASAALTTLAGNVSTNGTLTLRELRPARPPRPDGDDNGGNQGNERPDGPPPGGQNDGPPPQ